MRMNMNVNLMSGPNAAFGPAQTDLFGRKARREGGPASLLTGSFDPIAQKRAIAQKKAFKVVGETFASDRKLDGEFADRQSKVDHYRSVAKEAQENIRQFDDMQEQLRQEYGVEADSQEQKDLELLKRYAQDPMGMSWEEWDQVNEIRKNGLTEYQERAMEVESYKKPHLSSLKDAKKGIIEENAAIRAMTQERLKKDPMVKASKESQKILESAGKEIVGMLTEEAIDHVDEKFEEEVEEAEERKEEEKAEQERLDEAKERREELEALANPEKAEQQTHRSESGSDVLAGDPVTESILKMDGLKSEVKQEISDMMTKMNLVAEDLKGIKVDALL